MQRSTTFPNDQTPEVPGELPQEPRRVEPRDPTLPSEPQRFGPGDPTPYPQHVRPGEPIVSPPAVPENDPIQPQPPIPPGDPRDPPPRIPPGDPIPHAMASNAGGGTEHGHPVKQAHGVPTQPRVPQLNPAERLAEEVRRAEGEGMTLDPPKPATTDGEAKKKALETEDDRRRPKA